MQYRFPEPTTTTGDNAPPHLQRAGCVGVVFHSPENNIGCLAHIQAEPNNTIYLQTFKTFVNYMLSKIAIYGPIRMRAFKPRCSEI